MKMKKIIAMLLVLAMVLAFAGCATQEAPATEAPATEAPATEAPATEAPATEAPVEEDTGVMSYEEFLAAELESEVIIDTYVQGHQSWWDNKCTVYCQGPDGAYFLYEMTISQADAEKLVPGTKIRVTGDKAEWAGEVEVMYAICEFLEDGDTYIAEPMDATDLLGTEELIQHQNKLAAFNGMTVEAINYKNGEPGDDIYLTLGVNGASYEFCVEIYLTGEDSEVYQTVGALEVGDVVNVEGYLYWYEGVNPHITAISVVE